MRRPPRLPPAAVTQSAKAFSTVRCEILVEIRDNQIPSSVRSGIFHKSNPAGFENIARVVIHAEFFQQRNVFVAECFFGVMFLLVLDVTNHRVKL